MDIAHPTLKWIHFAFSTVAEAISPCPEYAWLKKQITGEELLHRYFRKNGSTMKTRKTLKLFVKVNTQSPDHFPTENGDCYFPIAIFTGLRPETTELPVFR